MVSVSASCALRRFNSALSTAARADAIAAGDGVAVGRRELDPEAGSWFEVDREDALDSPVARDRDRSPPPVVTARRADRVRARGVRVPPLARPPVLGVGVVLVLRVGVVVVGVAGAVAVVEVEVVLAVSV